MHTKQTEDYLLVSYFLAISDTYSSSLKDSYKLGMGSLCMRSTKACHGVFRSTAYALWISWQLEKKNSVLLL